MINAMTGIIQKNEAGRTVAKRNVEASTEPINRRERAWLLRSFSSAVRQLTQKRIAPAISRPCGLTAPDNEKAIGEKAITTPTARVFEPYIKASLKAHAPMIAVSNELTNLMA